MAKKSKKLSTREFSRLSGLSVSAVTQRIREGKIKAVKSSGRWQIPEDQLETSAGQPTAGTPSAAAAKKSSATEKAAKKSTATKKSAAASSAQPSGRISVGDFSSRTYLTEYGVVQYLKQGRLKGEQDQNGHWWVEASNLQNPELQHLLRPNVS